MTQNTGFPPKNYLFQFQFPKKLENCTSMINSQTAFAVPSQERDRGGARGEQQEEK